MSTKPVYSEQYFINLMAAAMAYGTIYVTRRRRTERKGRHPPNPIPSLHRRPTRNRKALPTTIRRRKKNPLNKHKLPLTWLKLELTSS